jgi:hypothetical protein
MLIRETQGSESMTKERANQIIRNGTTSYPGGAK